MRFKETLLKSIKQFWTDPHYEKIRAVFWFCLITILIHISWRFWVRNLDYFPVKRLMTFLFAFFVDLVYNQSTWAITNILHIKIFTQSHSFYCENYFGLIINEGCSGIKQILQFAILMLIIPGPWKHKIWYIPLGMIIVHFTNILRVIILTIMARNWPSQVKYTHDTWVRIMFYVVIFILWLIWVERIANSKIRQKDVEKYV